MEHILFRSSDKKRIYITHPNAPSHQRALRWVVLGEFWSGSTLQKPSIKWEESTFSAKTSEFILGAYAQQLPDEEISKLPCVIPSNPFKLKPAEPTEITDDFI